MRAATPPKPRTRKSPFSAATAALVAVVAPQNFMLTDGMPQAHACVRLQACSTMTFVPTPPKSQARGSTFRAAPTRPCSFRHRRRVSLHLGHAPARRVRVPHTRVARVFASPSRATSSSAPSVTVIRAACATLRLCGALVSERARAGGAGIVCLAMLALFVDVAVGRKSRTSCVKVKTRQKATLDFVVCEPRLRAAALRAAARRDNFCNGRCAPV